MLWDTKLLDVRIKQVVKSLSVDVQGKILSIARRVVLDERAVIFAQVEIRR